MVDQTTAQRAVQDSAKNLRTADLGVENLKLRAEIARLRAALRRVMEEDKVYGSNRGVLVGPAYSIAKEALGEHS